MMWKGAILVLFVAAVSFGMVTQAYAQEPPPEQTPPEQTPAPEQPAPPPEQTTAEPVSEPVQETLPVTTACPNAPGPIQCAEGRNMFEDKDANGCVVGYHCEGASATTGTSQMGQCPPNPPEIVCSQNTWMVDDRDTNGCIVGRHCEGSTQVTAVSGSDQAGCPPAPPGIECQYRIIDDFDQNGCIIGRRCVQDTEQTPQDYGRQCPVDKTCQDGSSPCMITSDGRCKCKPCPPPAGCREERDPQTGFVKVVCETSPAEMVCQNYEYGAEKPCRDKGGEPFWRTDARGCKILECRMNGMNDNPFQSGSCPPESEIEMVKQKCSEMGQRFFMINDRGCKVGICKAGDETSQGCGLVAGPVREKIEADCKAKGLGTVSDFDENGCQNIRCGNPNQCMTNLPEEAYMKCRKQGGEMVVKTDDMGCIVFKQCVMKGDDSQVYYEEVEKVPEMTELLSIAFKLEDLKMQFDRLRLKTEDIAMYYESIGSKEAERFKRIAGMFAAIKDKIDEIKSKLRDRVDSISKEDIMEVKHDVKYIKEKMLKDVIYIMLSSSDEVKEITSGEEKDCGNDGSCFNDALKVCKQVTFTPDGNSEVKIMGMEGANCMIKVSTRGMGGAAMGMECRYPNYAMGMNGPDDILPYCTGEMVEVLKKNEKTAPEQRIYEKIPKPESGSGGFSEPKQDYSHIVETHKVEIIAEKVKCVFSGSQADHECISDTGQHCRGRDSCVVDVRGNKGQKIAWKSTCGGFTATIIDGHDDYAEFDCANAPAATSSGGGSGSTAPCRGCLDNGICDQGECAGCADCMKGGGQ